MPVVVAVLRESAEGERRVALTPEVAKKLKARGAQIVIEKGAAASAYFADAAFADAEVVADGPTALARAAHFRTAPWGVPSTKPALDCTPTTALSWNSPQESAPA